MKVAIREFNNVYGIPTMNRKIYKSLEKYNVVVSVDSLFDKKHKLPTDKITIIVDGFAKLRSCGVPILGYTATHWGVYVKSPIRKSDIVNNKVTLSAPHYMRKAEMCSRPSLKLLVMFNECKCPEDFKKLQDRFKKELKDPKIPKFKWLRRALNQSLGISMGANKEDDIEAIKKIVGDANVDE